MQVRRKRWKGNIPGCVCLALFFITFAGIAHAQVDQSQDQNLQHPVTKDQKRLAKKKKAEAKEAKKETKALLKQHMKDQTPEVRKRMKRNARRANRYDEHKREFFIKRWFSHKKP